MRTLTYRKGSIFLVNSLGLSLVLLSCLFIPHQDVSASTLPGSMKTSLSKSSYSTTEDVVIKWTTSANATKYGLSVWKAPYGNDKYLVFDKYVNGTSKNIGKLPAGSYRVNMMPYNASGGGPVGNIIDFTVKAPAVVTPTPSATTPSATRPGSMKVSLFKSTFNTGENIPIYWTSSKNATRYGLTVRNAASGKIVWDNYVTGNSKKIGSLPAGKYRIKMIPYNGTKAGTVTSAVSFTVKAPAKTVTQTPKIITNSRVYPWNASNCPMEGYLSTGGADGNGGDGHGYGCRQCASYVAWKINQVIPSYYPKWGNAKDFTTKAQEKFGEGDGKPHAGSIAVMGPVKAGQPYGHVAWVETEPYISTQGRYKGKIVIEVSQYNYNIGTGYGMFSKMELPPSRFDYFVHIK
jgi:surface antigen